MLSLYVDDHTEGDLVDRRANERTCTVGRRMSLPGVESTRLILDGQGKEGLRFRREVREEQSKAS